MKTPTPFRNLSQPEQLRLLAIWRPYWLKAELAYLRVRRLEVKVKRPKNSWLVLFRSDRRRKAHSSEWCRREDRLRRAFLGLGSSQIGDLMEGKPLHPAYSCPLFWPS